MEKNKKEELFALCVEDKDSGDLEKRMIYRVTADEEASREGYRRVIDQSGEDYLYPESYFVILQLPREPEEAIRASTSD